MMENYNRILIITVTLLVSVCSAILLWTQPLNGDLTRIAAYPERWFGWNLEQQKIPGIVQSDRSPDKPHILVIGDSFSGSGFWQAYLSDKYSFDFIHTNDARLKSLLNYINTKKPDAVVIETGERSLPDMYGYASKFMKASDTCSLPEPDNTPSPTFSDIQQSISELPQFPPMERPTSPRAAKDISQGFHYLKLWSELAVKPHKRKAYTLNLTTDQLFSNSRSGKLLAIRHDFLLKETFDDREAKTIRCSLYSLVDRLEQTGVAFAILPIPDKTTTYQPYLADEFLRKKPALIDHVVIANVRHGIDILPIFRQMLAAGEQDVYLPNDTHWGYRGIRAAAVLIDREIGDQLRKKQVQGSAAHD